ncbi:MAG TPA: glycosyltransferase family 39 protein [Anaerolineae bacterium]|nr:glycosyltransferase family 39 protein [Anaerolineae bacterium]
MTSKNLTTTKPTPVALAGIRPRLRFTDLGVLILLALALFTLHLFTNGQYGFHRDELEMIDNARHLDWGFVDYPPLTPFVTRMALELFGPSLVGLRLFAALAQSIVMLLAGLMARELGGSRFAQIVAALAAAIAPIALAGGALLTYSDFDYLWWVLIAYLMIRLLKSDNPRWWLGIGAAIGLGLLTKYTILVLVAGMAIGVVLTRARRYLISPWLWGGVALALLICLPNLIWQLQHNFISLEFLRFIHARDVGIGRAAGFLPEQLIFSTNPIALPLWIAGLVYYFFVPAGKRYRALGWMAVVPFALLYALKGRSYYLAPAYPMLIAAGVIAWQKWLSGLSTRKLQLAGGIGLSALAAAAAFSAAIALPIAPVNSGLWRFTSRTHDLFIEQIGWPELVETVAGIYAALPDADKSQAGILTGNYGEAGAINLYGPAYGLPEAISGVNSYWLRGYGDPPPQVLILLGLPRSAAFEQCELAGRVTNRYRVRNQETGRAEIFLCRRLRRPWPAFWESLKSFG